MLNKLLQENFKYVIIPVIIGAIILAGMVVIYLLN
jgi:hypothetical protein